MRGAAIARRRASTNPSAAKGETDAVSADAVDHVITDPRNSEAVPHFDPEFVDLVARRVIELTQGAGSARGQSDSDLLTVAEIAVRLRVGAKWVYAHKHELGAIKLGSGPKARIRFDPSVVDARLASEHAAHTDAQMTPEALAAPGKRRRRRLASRPLPAIDRAVERA